MSLLPLCDQCGVNQINAGSRLYCSRACLVEASRGPRSSAAEREIIEAGRAATPPLSYGEIGAQLGWSKNKTIGRARRMGIAPVVGTAPPPALKMTRKAIHDRARDRTKRHDTDNVGRYQQPRPVSAPPPPKPVVQPPPPRPAPSVTVLPRPRTCAWIDGEDRRTWRQCDAPCVQGGVYCAAHRARCYRTAA